MNRLKLSRETLRQLTDDETPQVAGAGLTTVISNCYSCICPNPSKRLFQCVTVDCTLATARC